MRLRPAALMAATRRALERVRRSGDDGGAIVEFLGVTVLLLVPIVYGVVAIAHVQAASYAAEGASRAAASGAALAARDAWDAGASDARAFAVAQGRAQAVVDLAREDFGLDGTGIVELACEPGCAAPDGQLVADVRIAVTLPGIPRLITEMLPLEITVEASGTAGLDTWDAP